MKFIKWWLRQIMFMAVDGDGGGGAAGNAGGGDASGSGDAGAGGDAGGDNKGAGDAGASGAADGKGAGDAGAADGAGKADGKGKGTEGGYWPDDWREKASKGDAKLTARFARYANPEAALTALVAAQNRISSGELKSVLGKDAKPEEVAAWRAENGIPETPDKYDLNLGDGLVVGADDKPLVDQFLKAAHETNQTPAQVKATLKSYYAVNEQITADRVEKDRQIQDDTTETLRAEWGPEFKRNINMVHGLFDATASPELKASFLGGRLADGTPIGSSPEALKMLLGLALVNNPAGTVVPGGSGNLPQAVDDEIAKIEKGMRDNRAAYNKDEKVQARYRELLGAREQFNKRKVA